MRLDNKKGDVFMRILFKILAAPLVVILAVGTAVLAFLCGVAEWLLNIVSGLIVILAIGFFIDQQFTNGGIALVLAFLCSPAGLPAMAGWAMEKLVDLDYSLRRFITTP